MRYDMWFTGIGVSMFLGASWFAPGTLAKAMVIVAMIGGGLFMLGIMLNGLDEREKEL